jgi:hypothetical protein
MDIRADHYYQASLERMRQARLAYADAQQRSYALAIYLGGLAVECMLRAFRWRKDPVFEGRHFLPKLFADSGLLLLNEDRMQTRGVSIEMIARQSLEFKSAMNTVVAVWHNNLRYASETRVRAHLVQIGRRLSARGDMMKANALDVIQAAQKIVDRGTALWTLRKK